MTSQIDKKLIVVGRFPPPFDGQSVSTARFIDVLGGSYSCIAIDTMVPKETRFPGKISSFRKIGKRLQTALAEHGDATVIWLSISPQPSGHFRDLLTIWPRLKSRRVIAVVHWGRFARLFTQFTTRWTAPGATSSLSRIVFTDEILSAACSRWMRSTQRVVIPNSIDLITQTAERDVTSKTERGPGKPLRVLFLSNMIQEKGYLDVLQAAFLLLDASISVKFDFAGEWLTQSDKNEFDRLVSQHDASDSVRHLGPVTDRAEIKKLHLEADLLVLPSYLGEAQPLSIIEALCAGTPAIVADDGGMPAMIDFEKAGRVVPPRSPESIRDAILELSARETWTRCSRHARTKYLSTFSTDEVRRAWIELITEVECEQGVAL